MKSVGQLRRENRNLKRQLKEEQERADRIDDYLSRFQSSLWMMHAALGYPRIKQTGESFDFVVLRRLMKESKLPIPWRRLMEKDSITVARACAMFGSEYGPRWKRETAADEVGRQKYQKDPYMARWFQKFATGSEKFLSQRFPSVLRKG